MDAGKLKNEILQEAKRIKLVYVLSEETSVKVMGRYPELQRSEGLLEITTYQKFAARIRGDQNYVRRAVAVFHSDRFHLNPGLTFALTTLFRNFHDLGTDPFPGVVTVACLSRFPQTVWLTEQVNHRLNANTVENIIMLPKKHVTAGREFETTVPVIGETFTIRSIASLFEGRHKVCSAEGGPNLDICVLPERYSRAVLHTMARPAADFCLVVTPTNVLEQIKKVRVAKGTRTVLFVDPAVRFLPPAKGEGADLPQSAYDRMVFTGFPREFVFDEVTGRHATQKRGWYSVDIDAVSSLGRAIVGGKEDVSILRFNSPNPSSDTLDGKIPPKSTVTRQYAECMVVAKDSDTWNHLRWLRDDDAAVEKAVLRLICMKYSLNDGAMRGLFKTNSPGSGSVCIEVPTQGPGHAAAAALRDGVVSTVEEAQFHATLSQTASGGAKLVAACMIACLQSGIFNILATKPNAAFITYGQYQSLFSGLPSSIVDRGNLWALLGLAVLKVGKGQALNHLSPARLRFVDAAHSVIQKRVNQIFKTDFSQTLCIPTVDDVPIIEVGIAEAWFRNLLVVKPEPQGLGGERTFEDLFSGKTVKRVQPPPGQEWAWGFGIQSNKKFTYAVHFGLTLMDDQYTVDNIVWVSTETVQSVLVKMFPAERGGKRTFEEAVKLYKVSYKDLVKASTAERTTGKKPQGEV